MSRPSSSPLMMAMIKSTQKRITMRRVLISILILQISIFLVWWFFFSMDNGAQDNNKYPSPKHLPNYIQQALLMVNNSTTTTTTTTVVSSGSNRGVIAAQNHIFREYAKFHSSIMKQIRHSDAVIPSHIAKKVDFVLFKPHEHSGFGNIAVGLVSTFIYALLTQRVFLIDWRPGGYRGCSADLHDLIQEPSFDNMKIDWNFNTLPSTYKQYLFGPKNRYHLADTTSDRQSRETEVFLKCASSYVRTGSTSRYSATKISHKQIQDFEAAQYFAVLMFGDNPHYAQYFQQLFPFKSQTNSVDPMYKVDVFGPASRWLLKLTDELQEEVEREYGTLFAEKIQNPASTFVLGLQIRKNPREAMFYKTPTNLFWDCAKSRIMELKDSGVENVILFVSTDYEPAYNEGDKWFIKEKNSFPFLKSIDLRRVARPITLNAHSRDKEAVKHAMVELFLLNRVDDLIASEKSTFGHLVHGMKSLVPLVVRRENREQPVCIRAHSTEPWFHLRKRSNKIDCNVEK